MERENESGLEPVSHNRFPDNCMENEEAFWSGIKLRNAVRKRYYAMAALKTSEAKKVKKWLKNGDMIEIFTDSNNGICLLNRTRVENCSNPHLFQP